MLYIIHIELFWPAGCLVHICVSFQEPVGSEFSYPKQCPTREIGVPGSNGTCFIGSGIMWPCKLILPEESTTFTACWYDCFHAFFCN